MAKKKKTKKEKIISDLRRQLSTTPLPKPTAEVLPSTTPSPTPSTKAYTLSETVTVKEQLINIPFFYKYIGNDLRKTGILTSAVIVAELFLFFLLNGKTLHGF